MEGCKHQLPAATQQQRSTLIQPFNKFLGSPLYNAALSVRLFDFHFARPGALSFSVSDTDAALQNSPGNKSYLIISSDHAAIVCVGSYRSVTAPCDASDTSRMYFHSVPCVILG